MAYYKNGNYLTHSDDALFDAIHNPGAEAPRSGIYRCTGCGRSITSIQGRPLPPQFGGDHHPHPAPIRWQMVVMSHLVGGG